MAMCEKCNKGGFDPREMSVDESSRTFLGPCCRAGAVPNYGLSLTSQQGFHAYFEYGGMRMEYRKSPEELSRMVNGSPQPPLAVPPAVEQPMPMVNLKTLEFKQ